MAGTCRALRVSVTRRSIAAGAAPCAAAACTIARSATPASTVPAGRGQLIGNPWRIPLPRPRAGRPPEVNSVARMVAARPDLPGRGAAATKSVQVLQPAGAAGPLACAHAKDLLTGAGGSMVRRAPGDPRGTGSPGRTVRSAVGHDAGGCPGETAGWRGAHGADAARAADRTRAGQRARLARTRQRGRTERGLPAGYRCVAARTGHRARLASDLLQSRQRLCGRPRCRERLALAGACPGLTPLRHDSGHGRRAPRGAAHGPALCGPAAA